MLLDDILIDVQAGSYVFGLRSYGSDQMATVMNSTIRSASGEAIHVSGWQNRLFLYNTDVIQNAGSTAMHATREGSIHFWSGPQSPYTGNNRISGGKLLATDNGFIHAGIDAFDRSQNHFCDAQSAVLETKDGGKIYATHNYWYNDEEPSIVGTNIEFGASRGAAHCEGQGEVGDKRERLHPTSSTTSVDFSLRNHPNPFNPTTTLSFTLPSEGHVLLTVYDLLGRPVRTLIDEISEPGPHEVIFDATGLPSGTYLYRLVTPQGVATRMMSVVK